MNTWLMKSEPDELSIDKLAKVRVEPWTGVRNLMARNFMRKMAVGDSVLFYHSSVVPPGVAGLARVHALSHVDESQFDPSSEYFDPKATRDKPRWDCVDVEYVETFPTFVTLDRIREQKACADLVLLRQPRLSVQPVDAKAYRRIVAMGRKP